MKQITETLGDSLELLSQQERVLAFLFLNLVLNRLSLSVFNTGSLNLYTSLLHLYVNPSPFSNSQSVVTPLPPSGPRKDDLN